MRMLSILSLVLALAAFGPNAPDTVDVPVGSPLVDMHAWRPYAGRVRVAKITAGRVTPLVDATFTTVFRDSAGVPLMFMSSNSGGATGVTVLDRRTLAPYAIIQQCGTMRFQGTSIDGSQCQSGGASTPIHVKLETPAFFGNAADLVVEVLPRRTNVVYRMVLWQGNDSTETHLYRTTGREHVRVGGTLYRRAWVVDDYVAGSTGGSNRLASRMWIIDAPPYMVRWVFYNTPAPGSEVRAEQSVTHLP